jgi:hypothetical protein
LFAWISTFSAHFLSHSRPGSDAATSIASLATAIAKSCKSAKLATSIANLATSPANLATSPANFATFSANIATAIANFATSIAKSANLAQIRTNALQNLAQNSAGRRWTNAVAIGCELRTYRVVTEVGADIYAKDDDGWTNAAAKYGHFKS